MVLRDDGGVPIGLLCVNADVTEFDRVRRILDGFLGSTDSGPRPGDLFRNDWHERINRHIAAWASERGTTVARLDRAQRRGLIEDPHRTGAFEGSARRLMWPACWESAGPPCMRNWRA